VGKIRQALCKLVNQADLFQRPDPGESVMHALPEDLSLSEIVTVALVCQLHGTIVILSSCRYMISLLCIVRWVICFLTSNYQHSIQHASSA
jgi:hypothetical protein